MGGGIDFVLAYFLQQNVLNQKSLSKIKKILAAKYQLQAPDLNEMDLMLNEIEQNVNNEKKLNLSSSANHDDDDDDKSRASGVWSNAVSDQYYLDLYGWPHREDERGTVCCESFEVFLSA